MARLPLGNNPTPRIPAPTPQQAPDRLSDTRRRVRPTETVFANGRPPSRVKAPFRSLGWSKREATCAPTPWSDELSEDAAGLSAPAGRALDATCGQVLATPSGAPPVA